MFERTLWKKLSLEIYSRNDVLIIELVGLILEDFDLMSITA